MKKTKRVFSFLLAFLTILSLSANSIVLCASAEGGDAGTVTANTDWFDAEATELHIKTASDLLGLLSLCNSQANGTKNSKGKTFYLDNDIIRGIDRKHLDTQFAAIPYVAVTVNGCEVYYYGLWNQGQAFSMRLIAELALEDVQDAAGAGYENAVASGSQTGKFSPYTTEQRGLLDAYR